jgi:hypothetical protein
MSGSPPILVSPAAVEKESETISKGNTGTTPIISTDPPRGTRDFPPEDMRMRTWLFDNFREVSMNPGNQLYFATLVAEFLGWPVGLPFVNVYGYLHIR